MDLNNISTAEEARPIHEGPHMPVPPAAQAKLAAAQQKVKDAAASTQFQPELSQAELEASEASRSALSGIEK